MENSGRETIIRLALIWIFLLYSCRIPVSEYSPQNETEAAILSLLVSFEEARNRRDIQTLLPLLHPGGQFSYACGIMVSKEELAAKLPDFWEKLDSEKLGIVPLAHECLNGDYYRTGVLKDPEITVTGDRARVKVWFTGRWWSSLLLYLDLVREEGRWQVNRTLWGPS